MDQLDHDGPHERWQHLQGSTRRRFAAGLAASLFGFAGIGRALISPDAARAGYIACRKPHVYCSLNRVEDGCPRMCVYHCYDSRTLQYCWSFKDPC